MRKYIAILSISAFLVMLSSCNDTDNPANPNETPVKLDTSFHSGNISYTNMIGIFDNGNEFLDTMSFLFKDGYYILGLNDIFGGVQKDDILFFKNDTLITKNIVMIDSYTNITLVMKFVFNPNNRTISFIDIDYQYKYYMGGYHNSYTSNSILNKIQMQNVPYTTDNMENIIIELKGRTIDNYITNFEFKNNYTKVYNPYPTGGGTTEHYQTNLKNRLGWDDSSQFYIIIKK